MPRQYVGGLAARAFGAMRPLVDVDLYVPGGELDGVAAALEAAGAEVVRPPTQHRGDHWDLTYLKAEWLGWPVEVAAAEGARLRDGRTGTWRSAAIDFTAGVVREVEGVEISVIPLAELLAYKRALGRDVDVLDLSEIAGGA